MSIDLSPYLIDLGDSLELRNKLNNLISVVEGAVNASILGAAAGYSWQGFLDASGSDPAPVDGGIWVVDTAGTVDGTAAVVGDQFVSDGTDFQKIATSGAVVLDEDDFASDSAALPASQQSIAAYIAAQILDAPPEALNTLNELAAALGDDANFAATVTSALAGKQGADATLTALAGLSTAANKLIYATGDDAFSTSDLTALARTLLANSTAAAMQSTVGVLGLQSIFIPAGAMTPRETSGAESGSVETSTNKIMLQTLDFDAAADEFAQFVVKMPKSWNAGTITAQFVWSHPATDTNFGVRFFIQAVALNDGDAADTAFGTAVGATADTGGTTDDIYTTAVTGAITVANSPAKSSFVVFQVYRDVSDGGDTMAVDARLHGVSIFYTTDAATDS